MCLRSFHGGKVIQSIYICLVVSSQLHPFIRFLHWYCSVMYYFSKTFFLPINFINGDFDTPHNQCYHSVFTLRASLTTTNVYITSCTLMILFTICKFCSIFLSDDIYKTFYLLWNKHTHVHCTPTTCCNHSSTLAVLKETFPTYGRIWVQ